MSVKPTQAVELPARAGRQAAAGRGHNMLRRDE